MKSEPDNLTAREKEILELLVTGMTDSELAEELVVSVHTVHTHVANIFSKYNIHDRKKLIYYLQKISNINDVNQKS